MQFSVGEVYFIHLINEILCLSTHSVCHQDFQISTSLKNQSAQYTCKNKFSCGPDGQKSSYTCSVPKEEVENYSIRQAAMAVWAEGWKDELIGCFMHRGTPPGRLLPPQGALMWLTGAVQRKASVPLLCWHPSLALYMTNPTPQDSSRVLRGKNWVALNIRSRGSNHQNLPPSQTSCSRTLGQTAFGWTQACVIDFL